MYRFRNRKPPQAEATDEDAGLHRWVRSLPWVVELADDVQWPGVRLFAVDCEPLDRHRVWLVTGLEAEDEAGDATHAGIAVVLPLEIVRSDEPGGGNASGAIPIASAHMLVPISRDALGKHDEVEAFVLEAYDCAMSGDGLR
jgi:hypothetical protein